MNARSVGIASGGGAAYVVTGATVDSIGPIELGLPMGSETWAYSDLTPAEARDLAAALVEAAVEVEVAERGQLAGRPR